MKRVTVVAARLMAGGLTLGLLSVGGCGGVGSVSFGENKPQPVDYNQRFASGDTTRPAMSSPESDQSSAVRVEASGTSSAKPAARTEASASMGKPSQANSILAASSDGGGADQLRQAMAYPTGEK